MAVGETGPWPPCTLPAMRLDPDVRLLVPANDVAEPELSIVIPALDEEVTVGEFVDWCRQGLEAAGVVGRGAHRRQLERPDRRDRARARRARAANAAARPRTRVHRRAPVRARALRPHGRRRLHVRLPPARAVRREAPRGLRVRDGIALARLDRAGRDAVPAPVPRHAGDDLDPQPALRQPLLRHPLRHARDHARRARSA